MDILWSLFFNDKAPFYWDGVKLGLESGTYHEQGMWEEPTLDNFYGQKVLAERRHIFNSKFEGFWATAFAVTKYYFEI